MKMQHVTIQSGAYEESIRFYQEVAELKVVNTLHGPKEITFLANEEGETAIEIIHNAQAKYEGSGISIGFSVEDVEAYRETLVQKGYGPSPMISPNPMVKFFFVKDPNGVSIQFI